MEAIRQLSESSDTFATADRWGKAMDVMCDRVGEFISSDQLAAEAGMPRHHGLGAARGDLPVCRLRWSSMRAML